MLRLKTYIVEDSPVIRDNLIATLEELTPVQVVGFADDEPTATAWLAQDANGARLVIVDIFLKRGSGLGVLQFGTGAGRKRNWVVFSNYATAAMRNRCLALGADRMFDKSTEIDALVGYCNRLARGIDSQHATLS